MAEEPQPEGCDDATIPPQPIQDDATIPPGQGNTEPVKVQLGATPEIEGYELLNELGRGGMGVVYKARQTKLDRTVALKMILGGQLATEEAVRRFEIEAETAARLDHPGIVPIYEIGESNGHHFFSMKLIEGCSLSDCHAQYENDPRKSAELVIQIARAVHHAHERGVLHRDLKPANILIDSDGNAAVTDLGLAKQLDEDSGLTQTGLVMGSPGFMSPEQATGKSDVTTAVDTYALGAILYWMVAGRAPFEGDSRLDVILQTIDQEPQSLQYYRPEADRDLNLICQKALQKSARDRYHSAEELADDLQAWLDGEVISVRAPSALNMAKIWIRKNFRTVAIALLAGIICGGLVGCCTFTIAVEGMNQEYVRLFSQLGQSDVPWVHRYFWWLGGIPEWILNAMPILMIYVNVLVGIGLIGLIKPRSREVGLVAATAAALLAGILAYTINLGWSPIANHAVQKGVPDIELISDAFWMEDPVEQELARQSLMQRYPGLSDVENRQRGYLVFRKVINDQVLGIPEGMWFGIFTTLFLSVLPLFFATTYSGKVWDSGSRGWSFFGQSFEGAIYFTLIFLICSKWSVPKIMMPPQLGFQLATLAGIALALYFAATDKTWRWRVAGCLIASICVFFNFAESNKIRNASRLVQVAKSEDDFRQAASYTRKKIHQQGDNADRFQLAVLSAYLDDDEEYKKQCRALLDNFQNVYRPNVAERLAKACFLKPSLVDTDELNICHELAEFVSGYKSSNDLEWLYFVRAMSEMRQGNVEGTEEWAEKTRTYIEENKIKGRVYLEATCWLIEAMVNLSRGNEAKAEQLLDQAESAFYRDIDWKGANLDRLVYLTLKRGTMR